MTKLLSAICILATIFCACNNQTFNSKSNTAKKTSGSDTKYKGLHGTWVRHNREGFTLIEIKDTADILYYQFIDRKADIDTTTSDRYWYYRSKATMGYWNSPANPYKADADIWISTDKFRFDYKLKGDTLIEFDKMGDQGQLIRVYSDNQ